MSEGCGGIEEEGLDFVEGGKVVCDSRWVNEGLEGRREKLGREQYYLEPNSIIACCSLLTCS